MGLKDLAGTSALEQALATTNDLLQAVLDELRTTNNERLSDVVKELGVVSDKVDRLTAHLGSGAG